MKKLQAYLNGLPPPEQAVYAKRSGTTIGYLRKCISTGQKIGEGICINLERESERAVTVEDLRDDVDWAYLRNSAHQVVAGAAPNGIERRDLTRPSRDAGKDYDRRHDTAAAAAAGGN